MKKLTISLLLIFLLNSALPQNEANNWHFGKQAGISFNSGKPELILNVMYGLGSTSTMSDKEGNFLFKTNGESIWNRKYEFMQNGSSINGSRLASQGCLIVQKPGSDNIYYVFYTTDTHIANENKLGLFYSEVDMTLDNGFGSVTQEKDVLLTDAWDAAEKIVACRKENGEDIWIITRKFVEDGFAAFLLSANGLSTTAVISPGIDQPIKHMWGNMKISHDKKCFVVAYSTDQPFNGGQYANYEICSFNQGTGEIESLYTIKYLDPSGQSGELTGVEFSPDSKFLYLSLFDETNSNDIPKLFQYDMQFYEDSTQFVQSKIHIATGPVYGLQLARDGKIYTTTDTYLYYEYLSVIHEPWKRGSECSFEADAIDLGGFEVGKFLPNMLLDYYYRFVWDGRCQNEAFIFQPNFIPDPEYIIWNFGDPASGSENHSYELYPTHLFTGPGEFEVSVYLEYPGGRVEQTSRVVTVSEAPQADLGEDTLSCELSPITLNAGNSPGFYSWSTGVFGENANEITVSDTGTYWVRVEWNDCVAYDTIYVGMFPKPEINQDNLVLTPTACAGETGAITGLDIVGAEPLSYYWYDGSGTLLDSTLDLYNLAAGNYFLHITDGNGCTTISNSYTILDAGEVEITTVNKQDTHCNQQLGSITIMANTPIPGELLYSINNGLSWQNGDNIFSNLSLGEYFVRVKDENDCEGIWENNPVVVDNIDGPQVSSATSLPEIDHLSNGEINLQAGISSGDLHYSINNGNTFQTNDGHFTNLSTGTYQCLIKDDYGCDTSFILEVELKLSQLIEAIAGDGYTCIGNAAVVPLKLYNFSEVLKFALKLTYDTAMLSCDGYINVHPELQEKLVASIIPGTDEVIVSWLGENPISLAENAIMLELVFGAKNDGFTNIDWATLHGESVFYNEAMEEISANYHFGSLRIYTRPDIMITDEQQRCVGHQYIDLPWVTGGTGQLSYEWNGPDNFYSNQEMINIQNLGLQNAGIYTLTVSDTIDCVEQAHVSLAVIENPQSDFPPNDTIFEQPGFVLDAGDNYQNYLWNTGDTTSSIEIDLEGLYSVLITSGQDCKSTDSVTVLWSQAAFYLPNAFTPNGDGLNDEFKPVQKYDFVNTYHLSIYSRWGEMIFETSDINKGWDGSYKGNPTQQGTYIYKIVYTAWPNKEEQKVVTGSVMLVR